MNDLQIRNRTQDDHEQVKQLIDFAARDLRHSAGVRVSPAISNDAHARECTGVVAESKGRLVGTVTFRVRSGRLHVSDFYVQSDFRKLGVARKMVEELERIALKRNAKSLSLQTLEGSDAMVAFKRLGFRVQSAKPEFLFSKPGERALTTVYMVKRLAGTPSAKPGRWW